MFLGVKLKGKFLEALELYAFAAENFILLPLVIDLVSSWIRISIRYFIYDLFRSARKLGTLPPVGRVIARIRAPINERFI